MKVALALALLALSKQGNPTVQSSQGTPIYPNQQPMIGGGIIGNPMMGGYMGPMMNGYYGPMMGGPIYRRRRRRSRGRSYSRSRSRSHSHSDSSSNNNNNNNNNNNSTSSTNTTDTTAAALRLFLLNNPLSTLSTRYTSGYNTQPTYYSQPNYETNNPYSSYEYLDQPSSSSGYDRYEYNSQQGRSRSSDNGSSFSRRNQYGSSNTVNRRNRFL